MNVVSLDVNLCTFRKPFSPLRVGSGGFIDRLRLDPPPVSPQSFRGLPTPYTLLREERQEAGDPHLGWEGHMTSRSQIKRKLKERETGGDGG